MKEALKLALEALEQLDGIDTETECVTIDVGEAITAIKEALAQPEQDPVAWTLTEGLTKRETTTRAHLWFTNPQNSSWTPLYTTPPQHALMAEHWKAEYDKLKAACKPLSDEQYEYLVEDLAAWSHYVEVDTAYQTLNKHVRQVLAAHGIKE